LLSFTSCIAAIGNFIFIDAINLPLLISISSFSYEYSLVNPNDLMGKTLIDGTDKIIPLYVFLCPLRKLDGDSKIKEDIFDCYPGCVEYLVFIFIILSIFFFFNILIG
jgi:hypothetical protein